MACVLEGRCKSAIFWSTAAYLNRGAVSSGSESYLRSLELQTLVFHNLNGCVEVTLHWPCKQCLLRWHSSKVKKHLVIVIN